MLPSMVSSPSAKKYYHNSAPQGSLAMETPKGKSKLGGAIKVRFIPAVSPLASAHTPRLTVLRCPGEEGKEHSAGGR